MALAAYFPAATASCELFYGMELVYRLLCGLTAVLFTAAIFKFKNLKFQKHLCSVGAVLTVAAYGTLAVGYFVSDLALTRNLALLLPALAAVCALMAKGRIEKDYKLLHDSERIR